MCQVANFDRYTDIATSDNEVPFILWYIDASCVFLVVPERLIPNIHGIWMGYWWDIMFVHISLMKSCCSFTTIPHHAQIMPKYMKKYQKFETIFGMVVKYIVYSCMAAKLYGEIGKRGDLLLRSVPFNSNRFATRIAHCHGPTWPNQKPTGVKLGRLWP